MRVQIVSLFSLLTAAAAQADPVSAPYANAGDWEISTENHRACMMKRFYVIKDTGDEQELVILYDARRQAAALGWGSRKPKLPPLSGSLDFGLTFTRKGARLNEKWGTQPFEIQRRADEYRFLHVFNDTADTDRLLNDVASSDTIGLWFGPTLMMGLPLGAANAIKKLRECSSNIVE